MGSQLVINFTECRFAIIIVCIDNGKGAVNHILAAQHRVPRSPRFYPALRYFISVRQHIRLLVNILNLNVLFHAAADMLFEIFLYRFLYNEHDFFKSGFNCIVD